MWDAAPREGLPVQQAESEEQEIVQMGQLGGGNVINFKESLRNGVRRPRFDF